jgi:hypothetical protein
VEVSLDLEGVAGSSALTALGVMGNLADGIGEDVCKEISADGGWGAIGLVLDIEKLNASSVFWSAKSL